MKKIMVMTVAAACALSAMAAIPLAEARGQIDKAIANPALMGATAKQLSAEDQVKYMAEVNKAIAAMPASNEEKAAKLMAANRAILRNAAPGNVAALASEMFATVPLEALTVINENFATDLFNRASNPKVVYTDSQFAAIAENLMNRINDRCAQTDNGAARSAFAIIMLVRGSNGTPADLVDTLVSKMNVDQNTKDVARGEWIASALGIDGHAQSYDPILGYSDAGERPDFDIVMQIAGAMQAGDAVLLDLASLGAGTEVQTPVVDAMVWDGHDIPTFISDNLGAAGQAGGPEPDINYPWTTL